MTKTNDLIMQAGIRAHQGMYPVDSGFINDNDLPLDEADALMNTIAIALVGYAKLNQLSSDWGNLVMLAGAGALSEMDDALIRTALEQLQITQMRRKHL